MAGRADAKIAIFGRTFRLRQENVPGQAVRRIGTANRLGKGETHVGIAFSKCVVMCG